MGKDRSKKGAIKWATNFYCEKSPRGHVEAGVRGTKIRVVLGMDDDAKDRSRELENYGQTCKPDSIWAKEMDRIAVLATKQVRGLWDVWRDQNT